MAPVAPKKRTSMRAKIARANTSTSSSSITASSSSSAPKFHPAADGFSDTKRDRRHIKRSSFLSQIATKHSSAGGKITKRRRPSRKLVTNLDSLADALADLDGNEDDNAAAAQSSTAGQPGKVRLRSIRSRPGALKRKERLVRAEARAIGQNMAYLNKLRAQDGADAAAPRTARPPQAAATHDDGDEAMAGARPQDQTGSAQEKAAASSSTATRWAALRAHISGTMEQNPAFLEKK